MRSKVEVAQAWQAVRARIEEMPVAPSVTALVDDAAAQYGDRIAWSFFERKESLTFQDVQSGSRKAAALFATLGIKRGDKVAMMVENCPAYLLGWIGLMRIGAAVVPVNTRYTARELLHVLETSTATLLVIDHALLPLFEEVEPKLARLQGNRVIVHDGAADGRMRWDVAFEAMAGSPMPQVEVRHDDIANVQYTSGTTGFPKGCLLPQRWINVAQTWGEYISIPITNVICNQRLFYIDGHFLVMMCLYKGATFHICSTPSAAKFSKWLAEYKIDYCFYFDPLFKTPAMPSDRTSAMNLIQIFGFNRKNHAALERRYDAIARDSFGMSEYAPILIMPLDADIMVGSGSCGLEAPFTETRLVDEAGVDVPAGEAGELLVRSPAMMKGYVGDPVATAETLQDGWLKTGDLFVRDAEGFFTIVGRKKDMVRKNSENIACREVEDIIRQIPEILEVAMVGVKDDDVGEEPKVYIQLREGLSSLDFPPERLVSYCVRQLAPFKIPRYIEYVASFPMTDSARVAKKTLVQGVGDLRSGSYDRVTRQWCA